MKYERSLLYLTCILQKKQKTFRPVVLRESRRYDALFRMPRMRQFANAEAERPIAA